MVHMINQAHLRLITVNFFSFLELIAIKRLFGKIEQYKLIHEYIIQYKTLYANFI